MDSVIFLYNIAKNHLAVDQKGFWAFVDLEKAFDRVLCRELWRILSKYGTSGVLD